MFKKALKVASNNSLSGKDKKKLLADLSKQFDADALNALLEKNNPIVVANKLQGSKMLIYLIGDVPLFVDATGKGDFFPTIYAVQQCPTLTKSLEINTGIDALISSGANLMWPGVKSPEKLGDFNKDDVRYVRTSDNKIIGIGALACSSQELKEKGATGPAMFMLHIINDKLWETGPKKVLPSLIVETKKEEPQPIVKQKEAAATGGASKEEFKTGDTKKEKEKPKEESEESEEEEEEEEDDGANDLIQSFGGMIKKKQPAGQSKPGVKKTAAPAPKKVVAVKKEEEEDEEDEDDRKKKGKGKKGAKGKKEEVEETKKEKGGKGKKGKKQKGGSDEEEEDEEEEGDDQEEKKTNEPKATGPSIPTKVLDEYLMEAFLTALKVSVDDKHLPMDANDLYKKHILVCKREGISLDIKDTSYKKIGKFLQAMEKQDIIEFKESKKGAAPQITRINRGNDTLADFEPVLIKSSKKGGAKEEEVSEDDRFPKVEIQEVFKPKDAILQFLGDDQGKVDKDKYYTREEVQNALQKYINKENLTEKKFIKLDQKLRPLFWVEKPESEEEEGEGDEDEGKKKTKKPASFTISKEDLFKKLDDYLVPYHKIINLQTKKEEVKQGALKGINLVAEKSHNQSVTRMTGFEPFEFNVQSLVSKFQAKFECNVSTHNYKEKNVQKTEIVVNGGFIDEIAEYLENECKIDSKYINSTNKLEKKKKEKGFEM